MKQESGFTLTELVISLVVLSMIVLSFFSLFTGLVRSSIVMERKSVALAIATNHMEYLRGLSYNSLAVEGGSIPVSAPLPAVETRVQDNVKYTIRTSINYLDDAFDGCGDYPTQELKETYCRNYNFSPTAALDLNPADYKSVNVKVEDPSGTVMSEVDTQIAARVAETDSNTGGIFITVLDDNGNPLHNATVTVVNPTTSPAVNVSDATDLNGNAVFYNLPPDPSGFDYEVTASLSGYATLTSLVPSGTLQPQYPSLNVITQQSSLLTMSLRPQGENSLAVVATDTVGNPLPDARLYIKGGYKRYTDLADTSYYYDNMESGDSRPTTDAAGGLAINGLAPGDYYFCGDEGATGCTVSGATRYLAAAVPYGGTRPFGPIEVPRFLPSNSPPTYDHNGAPYLQKTQLFLTPISNFPRVLTLQPDAASLGSATINAFNFSITGANLPCGADPASCATSVTVHQGANAYVAECTGEISSRQINCEVDLSSAAIGSSQLEVTANGHTLSIPATLDLGGITIGA
ncbi:hypothetical protein CR970_01345 [Candidatus Saccharibacteria bacterium]|nr:MAG: hypothetical protein CR970_01345 [Candidatus Saccharibacteria bacterium]